MLDVLVQTMTDLILPARDRASWTMAEPTQLQIWLPDLERPCRDPTCIAVIHRKTGPLEVGPSDSPFQPRAGPVKVIPVS